MTAVSWGHFVSMYERMTVSCSDGGLEGEPEVQREYVPLPDLTRKERLEIGNTLRGRWKGGVVVCRWCWTKIMEASDRSATEEQWDHQQLYSWGEPQKRGGEDPGEAREEGEGKGNEKNAERELKEKESSMSNIIAN